MARPANERIATGICQKIELSASIVPASGPETHVRLVSPKNVVMSEAREAKPAPRRAMVSDRLTEVIDFPLRVEV